MRKILSILLIGVFVLGGAFTAHAQTTVEIVAAQLRPDFGIVIDTKDCGFKNVKGEYVYPVLYEGTTYLPLRAVAEIMGKKVNWDETNKTVTLNGTGNAQLTSASKDATILKQDIKVQLRNDFNIVIDGKTCTFKDVNGKTTYPVLFNGSTYLPLRAIGEVMGKTVAWDNTTKTVTLSKGETTVTDADSFINGTTTNSGITTTNGGITTKPSVTVDKDTVNKNYITKEAASSIALNKVPGATSANLEIEFDAAEKDEKAAYEGSISFNDMEYDFEIDALTGEIVEWEIDD